jgi:myo-inositol-1(or 4)-monophosphatase
LNYCAGVSDKERAFFEPVFRLLVEIANKEIEPRFLANVVVLQKKDHTPVTEADRSAELRMRLWIEHNYPQHGIYGEEFGIKEAGGEYPRYRWILDPVDGTRSFILNGFQFGTLIALERDDGNGFAPIMGAISHTVAQAWVLGDGQRSVLYHKGQQHEVHVRDKTDLAEAVLLTTSHWTTPEQKGDKRMQDLIDRVKMYRTFGDCFGYFAVATGGADIMVDPDLNYWDVAALVPVIEGAGGVLTSTTGGNPLKELSAVATNRALHEEVLSILNA